MWMYWGILQGNWGESLSLNVPVLPLMLERYHNSVLLMLAPFTLGIVFGVLLGLLSGIFRNTWFDGAVSVVTLMLISFPEFVIGTSLIIVFAQELGWFPATSMLDSETTLPELVRMLFLPSLTLLAVLLAHITRYTRISVIEVLQNDYIRTARAKGLSRTLMHWRHTLRNAILPVLPIITLMFGYLISGVVVIETLFAYPGLGRLLLRAITSQDVPLLQALMLLFTTNYVLMNLLIDLLYIVLNPRLRQI